MYAKYCPEKPLSHVDFLLSKYAGYEEDIIASLKEKYGPEPDAPVSDYHTRVAALMATKRGGNIDERSRQEASELLASHAGAEEHLIHSLMGKLGTEPHTRVDRSAVRDTAAAGPQTTLADIATSEEDPEIALIRRQERFFADISSLQQEQAKRESVRMNTSAAELSSQTRLQEMEIEALTNELAEMDRQRRSEEAETEVQIERLASQLTSLRMQKLRLDSRRDPDRVSIKEYEKLSKELTAVKEELSEATTQTKAIEEVLGRHLALYPMTPVRQTLRRVDPALCARLDVM